MTIDKNTCAFVAIGLGAAMLVWYAAYSNVDRNTIPDREIPGITFDEPLDYCTQHEFFRAYHATENQELGFTRHRYPKITGGNISTLIHHGMSPLRLPAPQDAKWITRPPAEVQW